MSRVSESAWDDLLSHVRTHHSHLAREGLSRLEPGVLSGGELRITLSDPELFNFLNDRCRAAFTDAAQAVTGHLVSVRFVYESSAAAAGVRPPLAALRLNRDYLFEHFVTGPENRLACAICKGVADAPGASYNPLFVHGPSGLGKTHLLQAVCHQVLAERPGMRVVYVTCESFVNDYISAIEHGDLHEFRRRYREADMLLVDDIQFLGRGERTQDEFFHTFNALYQTQRQIVLSSDCQPDAIPELAERLVSRFRWGLVARLDPLCVETRIAILRTKARVKGIPVADDVLGLIGSLVKGNARELEGALANVRAMAEAVGAPISVELARGALRTESDPIVERPITLADIVTAVCEWFRVKPPELRGRRRHRTVVLARQACMYLARRLTPLSLDEIGGHLGHRDHTTVLHAQRVISQRRESDITLSAALEQIEQSLRGADRFTPLPRDVGALSG